MGIIIFDYSMDKPSLYKKIRESLLNEFWLSLCANIFAIFNNIIIYNFFSFQKITWF